MFGMTAKDWVGTALPAWIQAIATIAALLIGYRTLRSWREEARVTQRAAEARELLKEITIFVGKIQRMTFPGRYRAPVLRDTLRPLIEAKKEPRVDLRAAHYGLVSKIPLITDKENGDLVAEMLDISTKRMAAYDSLRDMYEFVDDSDVMWGDRLEELEANVRTLGLRKDGEVREPDPLAEVFGRLMGRLRRHMNLLD